jgi:hypothetical protein
MVTISSRFKQPSLMSPRTAKYVEAMVREGFHYYEWLKEVREEEAQAKGPGTSGEVALSVTDMPTSTPDCQHGRLKPPLRVISKTIPVPRTVWPHQQNKAETPRARLSRWLERVRRASGEFQTNRSRDAVYDYLESVFAIVEHYRARRRTRRLLRHAFKFANLPFNKNADAFSAVIRCTSGCKVDGKTVSKYARALRYASRRKEPDMRLKAFMQAEGGVNACASLYAKHFGRNNRVAAI